MDILLKNMKKMKEMYPPNPLGGAFLANMKAYRESGLKTRIFMGGDWRMVNDTTDGKKWDTG